MRIVLISPYLDITSLSTRLLSSYLKTHGHSVVQIFLQDLESMIKNGIDFEDFYPDEVIDQVIEKVAGFDLLGMSLMSNYFIKMTHLTEKIREAADIPIVWGGVHPTVAPDQCMDIADYVCVGEGEEALLELANCLQDGIRPADVKNIWFKDQQGECRNPVRDPIANLDDIPFPDYDLEDQFILVGSNILPFGEDILKEMVRGRIHFNGPQHYIYETMWTRGCPHQCTYCINSHNRTLYKGCKTVRRRSIDSVIEEIKTICEKFPWLNRINFMDDDFASASEEQLSLFRDKYKEEIGHPFYALLSVLSSGEKKLSILYDAGLRRTQIGIQTLAVSTNELYRRYFFNKERLLDLARSVRKVFPPSFCPTYDVILENPWETTDNELTTLRGILELPRPFVLQLYTLTFYPGTVLFDKAVAEGIIREADVSYLKENHDRKLSYVNFLFMLVNMKLPNNLIKCMAWRPITVLMRSHPVKFVLSLLTPVYRTMKIRGVCKAQKNRFQQFLCDHSKR